MKKLDTNFVRPTREILAEIENQGRKCIFFVDDNLLSNHEAVKVVPAGAHTLENQMGLPDFH